MSSSLSAFAEDPAAHLPAPVGATIVDDERFYLSILADGRRAGVCRLRLADHDVEDVFAGITRLVPPEARAEWIVGPSSTPATLEARLRALGCRDQDPPLTSHVAALATTAAPPAVDGIDVKPVETYAEFLIGLEVAIAGWEYDEAAAQRERDLAPETWERHRARSGGDWIAYLDDEPVGYAGAFAGPVGLFLTGGVTLPWARGRGAYRALVRARWDEAVGRGTPALVVHAEEASRRVLETIGFRRVCEIVELVTDARA